MIFLQILKIIGIVLLCVLALVLLIIILVLFVPIRYQISGNFHGQILLKARVTYLLHILRAGASYQKEDGFLYSVHVLWIKLFPKARKKKTKSSKKKSHVKLIEKKKTKEEAKDSEKSELSQLLDDIHTDEFGNDTESDSVDSKAQKSDEQESPPKKKHKKRKEPLKTRLEKLWKKIQRQYKKWKRILTDKHNKIAFEHIKKVLFKILKGIMPRKLKLNAKFSTGSPDTTAEILGVLAMFPIGYKNRWKIYPDFEAEKGYFDGDFDIRGKIYIFKILFPALGLIFDKRCRRLFKMVRK